MKKILISAAICSMLFTAGASANWITGEPSIMAVNGGEAAFHTSLNSAQRLDINLTSGTSGKADMIFSAEGYDDSLTLSSLPVKAVTETGTNGATYTDSKVTVTPLINDGNGQRFYLVDTGDGLGMTIVAYSKGSFKTAFSTSSLPETYGTGSFEVSKKAILFHGKNANGESTYTLTYDKKTGLFNAAKNA